MMASEEHDQPALAVKITIGQSVAQSGNKTIQTGSLSQQKPRSVTVSLLITSLARDPCTSQPVTFNLATINTALQTLAKAQ